MSNYFHIHENRWTKAYIVGDQKSFNLHLRKQYIVDEIRKLETNKDSKILDIGCGTGEISFKLESTGYTNIIAQDISQKFIDIAKKNQIDNYPNSQISFSQGGVSNLDFNNETFHIVIASGLIEWVRYDRWVLQEIWRVLKLGGYLIVTGPNKLRLSNILTLRRLWHLWKSRKLPRVQHPFSRHLYSYRGLTELLEIAGYEVKKLRTNGFAQLPPVRWNSVLSFKTFKFLQYIADKKPTSWIGKTGSNIISVAQKPLKLEIAKYLKGSDCQQFCIEYENQYHADVIRLNNWKNNNKEFLLEKELVCNTSINHLNKILVIAPHPDDEIIGCGGLLIGMKKKGAKLGIIYLTDGRSTSGWKNAPPEILNTPRYHEARNVCNSIKVDMASYLDGVSGQLKTNRVLEESVSDFIVQFNPEVILIPFINDPHQDHIESNKILARALKISGITLNEIMILSYEVWSFVPANIYYKIDEFSIQKTDKLMKYKTAMQVVNYIRNCLDRSIYHGINKNGVISQMEAFYGINGKTYLDLIKKLD